MNTNLPIGELEKDPKGLEVEFEGLLFQTGSSVPEATFLKEGTKYGYSTEESRAVLDGMVANRQDIWRCGEIYSLVHAPISKDAREREA
jgi:hypothetical protein